MISIVTKALAGMTAGVSLILLASCASNKSSELLKECPEEKIINRMPVVGKPDTPTEYYILNGERREINEFDTAWVRKNCEVKETVVY